MHVWVFLVITVFTAIVGHCSVGVATREDSIKGHSVTDLHDTNCYKHVSGGASFVLAPEYAEREAKWEDKRKKDAQAKATAGAIYVTSILAFVHCRAGARCEVKPRAAVLSLSLPPSLPLSLGAVWWG